MSTPAQGTTPDNAMIRKLREPVDQGGYDGWAPNTFHIAVADRLEELWVRYQTEQIMHLAWRKRAEEAEAALHVASGYSSLGIIIRD
jgi:hypothetical protein